jgi:hypothetical protein
MKLYETKKLRSDQRGEDIVRLCNGYQKCQDAKEAQLR